MTAVKNPRWDTGSYRRMADVRYADGVVHVRFEDGDDVVVPAERLLGPQDRGVSWQEITFDPYEIQVPATSGPVERPWSAVRKLTDPEYAAFVKASAEDWVRRMGERVRELRVARGLTARRAAALAGISPQALSRIEHGRQNLTLALLGQIVTAMGYSYDDLITEQAATRTSVRAV